MDDEEEFEDTETEDVSVSESAPVVVSVEPEERNLEDAFQSLFKTSASGTGEEELLKIASTYSRQISAAQIRAILYLEWIGRNLKANGKTVEASQVSHFVDRWLELKQYNNSDMFVMRALDSISLRKFIGENAFKIDIQK